MADEDAPVLVSESMKRFKRLREKLERELRANPLDFENPPTEQLKDTPHPMAWISDWPNDADDNPKAPKPWPNSAALMKQIVKGWEMEQPSMSLVWQGGSQHPLQLIQDKGFREQRTDFLKSRPRFDDTYFDGQRDPIDGWMTAVNAWRYPAFYIGPNYTMPEFTFKPPHTLFIDATLQVCGENAKSHA